MGFTAVPSLLATAGSEIIIPGSPPGQMNCDGVMAPAVKVGRMLTKIVVSTGQLAAPTYPVISNFTTATVLPVLLMVSVMVSGALPVPAALDNVAVPEMTEAVQLNCVVANVGGMLDDKETDTLLLLQNTAGTCVDACILSVGKIWIAMSTALAAQSLCSLPF